MKIEHLKSAKTEHNENNENPQSLITDGPSKCHVKCPRQKNNVIKQLPDKEFKLRNSVLIDLIEKNPHIRTIYHMCIAVFIYSVVNTAVHDYVREGRLIMGTDLIVHECRKIHLTMLFWLLLTLMAVAIFYLFKIWAIVRITVLPPKGSYFKIWDTIGVVTYIVYYITSFTFSSSVISTYHLPVTMASVICLEQCRYLMKVHSFLRQNAEKVLKYKTHSDEEIKLPALSHFMYFQFAPTMIYRDEYPRTDTIRWKFIASRLLDVVLCVLMVGFIAHKMAVPYEEFLKIENKWIEIILCALQNCVFSLILFLMLFYVVLHCAQNIFAELLRFGDRLFYEDWWNCTGFLRFFRTWNILVSDWLYTYIYKDVYELLIPNKHVAKFTVFIISAIVHEWLVYTCLGFFIPVLLLQMLMAGSLALKKDPKSQAATILMWVGLLFGTGFNITIYALEYMIRYSSLLEHNIVSNTFVPQIYLLGQ